MNFKYRAVERAWFRRRVGKTFGDVSYYNASLGDETKEHSRQTVQTSYVRGDIPFLPVEEPRPAAHGTQKFAKDYIQHINALLYVTLRRGAGRGSNHSWIIFRNGMDKVDQCNVRSDLSRVHRGSRTERREFASLEPRKGEVNDEISSCDAVTSSSRTRGVGLEEVRVGSRYVTAVPF